MKVEQFKEQYEALQKEGNEIYAQMKPLLKRLKALSKKCLKLGDKADADKELYCKMKPLFGEEIRTGPNGWDTALLSRLWDFECLVESYPDNTAIDAIDNVLYNLKHTKFKRRKPTASS